MAGIKYIRASDGTGEAVRPVVTGDRAIGNLILTVNSVSKIPTHFIATSGKLLGTGKLDPNTINQFRGRVTGTTLTIESFVASYPDKGNSIGDVILIKPSTAWANELADLLSVAHNDDGSLKTAILDALKTEIYSGNTTLSNKRIQPRNYSTASTATLTPDLSAYNVYTVTAQAVGLTIGAPIGTPTDGEVVVFRFKDNGTARSITWNAVFRAIGDSVVGATTAGKWTYVNCMYNANASKWDVLPAITEV